ncbi:hypothetical protein P3342_000424 [Pyrenophora teres f. teres]|nr:hypothetical protein P3342_000424 [Pyrenophora teres f. teres]
MPTWSSATAAPPKAFQSTFSDHCHHRLLPASPPPLRRTPTARTATSSSSSTPTTETPVPGSPSNSGLPVEDHPTGGARATTPGKATVQQTPQNTAIVTHITAFSGAQN